MTKRTTSGTTIELTLPPELFEQLRRIATASGLHDAAETATVGLAAWAAERIAALDNQDPAQKYFINEALDELATRK